MLDQIKMPQLPTHNPIHTSIPCQCTSTCRVSVLLPTVPIQSGAGGQLLWRCNLPVHLWWFLPLSRDVFNTSRTCRGCTRPYGSKLYLNTWSPYFTTAATGRLNGIEIHSITCSEAWIAASSGGNTSWRKIPAEFACLKQDTCTNWNRNPQLNLYKGLKR